jgi:hypothetical protein
LAESVNAKKRKAADEKLDFTAITSYLPALGRKLEAQ